MTKFAHFFSKSARPEFAGRYIDYAKLKAVLSPLAHKTGEANRQALVLQVSRTFLQELQSEIARLNVFVLEELELCAAERRDAVLGGVGVDDAKKAHALWRRTEALRAFAELNYAAIYKAAKKHDKRTGLSHAGAILETVEAQPFASLIDAGDASMSGPGTPGSVALARRAAAPLVSHKAASLPQLGLHSAVGHSDLAVGRAGPTAPPRAMSSPALVHSDAGLHAALLVAPRAIGAAAGAAGQRRVRAQSSAVDGIASEGGGRAPSRPGAGSELPPFSWGLLTSSAASHSLTGAATAGGPSPALTIRASLAAGEISALSNLTAALTTPALVREESTVGEMPSPPKSSPARSSSVLRSKKPPFDLRHAALTGRFVPTFRSEEGDVGATIPNTPAVTPGAAIADGETAAQRIEAALAHLTDTSAGRSVPLLSTAVPAQSRVPGAPAGEEAPRSFAHDVLSWDDSNADAAGVMLRQFETSVRSMHDFTNAALQVVAPHLASSAAQVRLWGASILLSGTLTTRILALHVTADRSRASEKVGETYACHNPVPS